MSLAANLRLAGLLLMLGLAGCAVPERAPPATPPVPVSEATWQQVDSDIVNGSLAAKGSAKSFVRHQMERWQLLVTEKAEAAFIPWFSSYVTQQWLTVKVAWYHMSSEDGKALPADRLAAYMQEQYYDRVLAPVAEEIDPASLAGQATQRYIQTLRRHLQQIPQRHGVPDEQFKQRLAGIPAIRRAPPPAHDASLYQLAYHEPVEALPAYEALLQGIRDGGGNDGVGLSKTRISPVARNVSEQLLHKLAISGGTSAASALAGGIAGSVISLGATVFGVIWHEAGRKEIETELRATLSDSVADMWRSLMDNPDTGVAAGIYHIADQIENHLPQTVARPIPFENPPREIPLPELPPSPETGDGEEALDEGGDQ
jgi:hypothetical protein